jgi:hypothetical protein
LGPGQNGGQQSLASMIFLSIHKSLSVISLSPKSKALSLMVVTAGNVVGGAGTGTDGSEDKSPRMEEVLGCARGTKAGAGDTVVEVLNISSETTDAPPTPPMERELAMEAPPATNPLFGKVNGDISP